MNNRFLIIFLLSILILSSCKTIKPTTTGGRSEKNINKLLEEIEKRKVDFSYMKAKAQVRFKSAEMSQEVTLNLRIRKDSLIWGSVSALLGLEVARIYVSQNQIIVLDKINKKYYEIPFSYIETNFLISGVNYELIQNLILGNSIFTFGSNFSFTKEENSVVVAIEDEFMTKKVWIDPTGGKIDKYDFVKKMNTQHATVVYNGRIADKGKAIPQKMEISAWLPDLNSIFVDFSSLTFDEPFTINANIPQGYEKVE